jgi:hypothetical protein
MNDVTSQKKKKKKDTRKDWAKGSCNKVGETMEKGFNLIVIRSTLNQPIEGKKFKVFLTFMLRVVGT